MMVMVMRMLLFFRKFCAHEKPTSAISASDSRSKPCGNHMSRATARMQPKVVRFVSCRIVTFAQFAFFNNPNNGAYSSAAVIRRIASRLFALLESAVYDGIRFAALFFSTYQRERRLLYLLEVCLISPIGMNKNYFVRKNKTARTSQVESPEEPSF